MGEVAEMQGSYCMHNISLQKQPPTTQTAPSRVCAPSRLAASQRNSQEALKDVSRQFLKPLLRARTPRLGGWRGEQLKG